MMRLMNLLLPKAPRISARARQYYEKSENSVAQLQSL